MASFPPRPPSEGTVHPEGQRPGCWELEVEDHRAWPELQEGSLHFPGSSGEQGAHSQLRGLRSQLMVTSRRTGRRLRKSSRPRAHPLPPEHSTHMHTPSHKHTPHICTHRPKHVHTPTRTHPCTCTRTHAHVCTHIQAHIPTHPRSTHRAAQDARWARLAAWSLLAAHPARASVPPGGRGVGTGTGREGPALTLCGHITRFSCAALRLCVCLGSMVARAEGTAGAPK